MRNINAEKRVKEYLKKYTENWAFSGSIAVMVDDEIVIEESYGYANRAYMIENSGATKYKIWSLTKQFTAAAILILEERGLLSTNDLLSKYFPKVAKSRKGITIHQLLTHTSGIFNYTDKENAHEVFYRSKHKKEERLHYFLKEALENEPGTTFNYSNTGYYILGIIIERVSGKPYEVFLKDEIFDKIGMENTGLCSNVGIIENIASGYYLNKYDLINCEYVDMNLMFSSGGMYATAHDLLLWDRGLRGGNIISSTTLKKMQSVEKDNYAYGLFIEIIDGEKVASHSGSCEGFISQGHSYIDEAFTVVVLSNYGFTNNYDICSNIRSIFKGKEVGQMIKPKRVTGFKEQFDGYLGLYRDEEYTLEIKSDGEDYIISLEGEYDLVAYPIGENKLHHKWIDESYEIEIDDDGKPSIWGLKKL